MYLGCMSPKYVILMIIQLISSCAPSYSESQAQIHVTLRTRNHWPLDALSLGARRCGAVTSPSQVVRILSLQPWQRQVVKMTSIPTKSAWMVILPEVTSLLQCSLFQLLVQNFSSHSFLSPLRVSTFMLNHPGCHSDTRGPSPAGPQHSGKGSLLLETRGEVVSHILVSVQCWQQGQPVYRVRVWQHPCAEHPQKAEWQALWWSALASQARPSLWIQQLCRYVIIHFNVHRAVRAPVYPSSVSPLRWDHNVPFRTKSLFHTEGVTSRASR